MDTHTIGSLDDHIASLDVETARQWMFLSSTGQLGDRRPVFGHIGRHHLLVVRGRTGFPQILTFSGCAFFRRPCPDFSFCLSYLFSPFFLFFLSWTFLSYLFCVSLRKTKTALQANLCCLPLCFVLLVAPEVSAFRLLKGLLEHQAILLSQGNSKCTCLAITHGKPYFYSVIRLPANVFASSISSGSISASASDPDDTSCCVSSSSETLPKLVLSSKCRFGSSLNVSTLILTWISLFHKCKEGKEREEKEQADAQFDSLVETLYTD